jgi:hypothetical protein
MGVQVGGGRGIILGLFHEHGLVDALEGLAIGCPKAAGSIELKLENLIKLGAIDYSITNDDRIQRRRVGILDGSNDILLVSEDESPGRKGGNSAVRLPECEDHSRFSAFVNGNSIAVQGCGQEADEQKIVIKGIHEEVEVERLNFWGAD